MGVDFLLCGLLDLESHHAFFHLKGDGGFVVWLEGLLSTMPFGDCIQVINTFSQLEIREK